jgi:hypothetical protein
MPHLRLVDAATEAAVDDRPRVSLRLLMAISGRCSCDDCLLAYRAGDRSAGVIDVSQILGSQPGRRLHAVR